MPYSPALTATGGSGGPPQLVADWSIAERRVVQQWSFQWNSRIGSAASYPISVTVTDPPAAPAPKSYTIVIILRRASILALATRSSRGWPYHDHLHSYGWSPALHLVNYASYCAIRTVVQQQRFSGTPTSAVSGAGITLKVTDNLGVTAGLELSLTVISPRPSRRLRCLPPM